MMTAISEYLARLDVALRGVPHGIAAEIRAGIAEELQSLDPDAAAARIAQLGDPAVIAREALDAEGHTPPAAPAPVIVSVPAPAPLSVPVSASRGFAIAAALTLSFGGYLVPVVGWFVGVALVLMSSMWRTWEKVVAILAPVALFGLLALLSLPAYAIGSVQVSEESGTGTAPEVMSPLGPNLFAGPHLFIILIVAFIVPVSGLWLLWRMRGRTTS